MLFCVEFIFNLIGNLYFRVEIDSKRARRQSRRHVPDDIVNTGDLVLTSDEEEAATLATKITTPQKSSETSEKKTRKRHHKLQPDVVKPHDEGVPELELTSSEAEMEEPKEKEMPVKIRLSVPKQSSSNGSSPDQATPTGSL